MSLSLPPTHHRPPAAPSNVPRLASLGALAAGFGLMHLSALAQTAPVPAAAASAPLAASTPAKAPEAPETTMQAIAVKGRAETDATSVRATSSSIGKGVQDLRDIPQSVTVVTQKLLEDRRVDTLKEALHQTAGVTFLAAEGGEEDVRLRGFSLAASGDIYLDGIRDPAFYERDTFSYDRVEVLRGSASMLFGRGSTGGVVNQVQKQAVLADMNEVSVSGGSGGFLRLSGDFNIKTGDTAGLRINVMKTDADNYGNFIDKQGLAVNLRWGVGSSDEFSASGYYLHNNNGVNYGLPWLRVNSDQASANPSGLIAIDPRNYYGAASDYNRGGAQIGTLGWTHRFGSGGELKTVLRQSAYDRDMRASSIRFCVAPTCAGFSPPGQTGSTGVTAATPLTRGTNNKVQDLHNRVLQSDYTQSLKAFGLQHDITTGIEFTSDAFKGYATVLPAGATLDKNAVRTTIGTPDDGTGWVDEARRIKLQQSGFTSNAAGAYLQDMLQVTDTIKLLGGLRYDRFSGNYRTLATAVTATTPVIGAETANRGRSDGLWSKRLGALYQPDDKLSFHASWGTSFNTSGDTYQYDLPGSNTPPEGSENLEVGAKLDLLDSRLSTRFALFRSTKTNERNRDSPSGEALVDYLLSGRRHATGFELDLAGKITAQWEVFGSYAFIFDAKIDKGNADGSALTGEQVGQWPSITPRHSGTLWSTYQFTPALRLGAGLNARSAMTPNRNPAGVVAPRYVTADLLAEYTFSDSVALKLNINNVGNKLYADALYTAHYVPGAPRAVQVTLTTRF